MSSPAHLKALHRANRVSADQSPFYDTFQVVTNGVAGRPLAAHDMVCGPLDKVLADGGLSRSEVLSFAVLKRTLPQSLPPRSMVRARNRMWIIESVSGEDPAQSSWKFSALPE